VIIDRYMMREVGFPFVGVSAVLLTVFVTFSLTRFLADASSGLLNATEVTHLTALKGLIALEVLLPIALYVAVILGLGRLYRDSEMVALRAGGVSENRLLRPILSLAALLAIAVGVLSLAVRPWAYAQMYQLRAVAEATSELGRIKPGLFYSYEQRQRTIFIDRMSADQGQLEGVFIRNKDGQDLEVVSSKTGRFHPYVEPDFHELSLFDANVFKKVEDGPDIYGSFGTLTVRLRAREPDPVGYKTKAESTGWLLVSNDPFDRAELQWRISTAVSTLLLAMLAVPLSRSKPRQGRYAKLLVAMLLYAFYYNLLGISRTWVEQQSIGSIWPVVAVLGVIVAGLYSPWQRWHNRFRQGGQDAAP
jgi:lipopolysaccharide export system permease protein